MVSAAQVILATETRRIRENPTLVADDAETLNLVAASRILAYAGAEPDLPEADRNQLLHLAALGYAAHGNFPAALAIARTLLHQGGRTENELVALGVAAPRVIPDLLRNAARGSAARELLEVLAFNSRSREPEDTAAVVQQIVERFPTVRDPYESTLLMLAVTASHVRNVFSLVRSDARLPIDDDYLEVLAQSGIRTLLPPQYRVINEGRLFEAPGNVAISLPTSTGKTLLGEMMLMRDLGSEPGMVVYVAPYVALGSQIRRVLRDHFPKSVRITPLIGGYTTEISLEPSKEREVVIATPERLDSLLRSSPELAQHVRCVVVDEAHHLGSGERGARLEGILTRLRLLQEKSTRLRLVLLSAVVDNIGTLEGWLGRDAFVYRDTWQPTARRLSVWFDSGALVWFAGSDVLTRKGKKADDVIGQYQLPWPFGGIVPSDQFQVQRRQKEDLNRNAAYLVRFFLDAYQQPLLCLCATKADTRRLAYEIADRLESLGALPESIGTLVTTVETRFPYLRPLAQALKKGVAYHNAGLPPEIKDGIEQAAHGGELMVVVSTTTLAEGIDLPFRFTILVDWLAWGAEGTAPLSPLLFANMAGRSGRAGLHTEGDTIVIDNPIGEVRFTNVVARREHLRRILGFEGLKLLNSQLRPEGLAQIPELRAVLGSQLLAAVPENPEADDLTEAFANASLAAAQLDEPDLLTLKGLLGDIRNELLDSDKGALAVAASPLRLTRLGQAAVGTGFSPATARLLLHVLDTLDFDPATPPQPAELGGVFLTSFGLAPEQSNGSLKAVILKRKGARFPVRPEDFEGVLEEWLGGLPEEILFEGLPYVRRSTRKDNLGAWRAGTEPRSSWQDEFEKFLDFLGIVTNFLPWLFRGARAMVSLIPEKPATAVEWETYAQLLEAGVDSLWAVGAVARGAPSSRLAIVAVGRRLQQLSPDLRLEFGMERIVGLDIDEAIGQAHEDLTSLGDAAVIDLEKLRGWYHEIRG